MNVPAVRPFKAGVSPSRLLPILILSAGANFAASNAQASVCVDSKQKLLQVFAAANNDDEGAVWDIRVQSGTYILGPNENLIFSPPGDKDNKQISLTGGWDSGCSHRTYDSSLTTIKGTASTAVKTGTTIDFYGNNRRYDIEFLRFEDFGNFRVTDVACPQNNICPDTDSITVKYSEFRNGESVGIIAFDAHDVVFRSNLAANIKARKPGTSILNAPIYIDIENSENPPQISFNTLADLQCAIAQDALAIHSASPVMAFHHNIVSSSTCPNDVYIDQFNGAQPVKPFYNLAKNFAGKVGGDVMTQGNVITADPRFVAAGSNYRLFAGNPKSPAINAGQTEVDADVFGTVTPSLDLDGKARPVGVHFDIGAYESDINDGLAGVLKVTNTNDSGDGSLRKAIQDGNNAPDSAQRIQFAIPGGCPQTILLQTALPDIIDSLVINGYTQPGASANTQEIGSDAEVCVVIAAGATGIGQAFNVPLGQPNTTLVVEGVAFGSSFFNFSNAAVQLRSGNGHALRGNVFGGLMPGGGNLNSLPRGVIVRGTASNVSIGGTEVSDRNYFGGLTNNAVVINDATTAGHRILGNYFGVTPNGLSAQPNFADAISATGGSATIISDNVIAASGRGILLSNANTKDFLVRFNKIGVNAAGLATPSLSNEVGIEIGGGSGQHVIGAGYAEILDSGEYSNDIRNNTTAGINVTAFAGSGVTVRGNRIADNAKSGTGLGIDLGALGVAANDPDDGDTGGNDAQNHPSLKGSSPNGFTRLVRTRLVTTPLTAVNIDLYRAADCPGGATGANASYVVGNLTVTSDAAGLVDTAAFVTAESGAHFLTATVTTSSGSTSELSSCMAEDTIYRDGFSLDD